MKKNLTIKRLFLISLASLFFVGMAKAGPTDMNEYMRVNLFYSSAAGNMLLDGNLTQYDDGFSNNVDYNDAWKMTNFGENFGIARNGVTLVIERRKRFLFTDTTTFRMWNLLQRTYTLELITFNCNHPNVSAVLEDNYLGTGTPIDGNGTTKVSFAVTADPGSYSENRFRVVFRFNPLSQLPFNFGSIRVIRSNGHAQILWRVNNEEGQVNYEVERSADGISFQPVSEVASRKNDSFTEYQFDDQNITGDIMYRIKTTDYKNNVTYSEVARLFDEVVIPELTVYPNPVINKRIRFFLESPVTCNYRVMLSDYNGSVIYQTSLRFEAGQVNQSLIFPSSLPAGMYILRMVAPGMSDLNKKLIIK